MNVFHDQIICVRLPRHLLAVVRGNIEIRENIASFLLLFIFCCTLYPLRATRSLFATVIWGHISYSRKKDSLANVIFNRLEKTLSTRPFCMDYFYVTQHKDRYIIIKHFLFPLCHNLMGWQLSQTQQERETGAGPTA